jgi:hypothetical protein
VIHKKLRRFFGTGKARIEHFLEEQRPGDPGCGLSIGDGLVGVKFRSPLQQEMVDRAMACIGHASNRGTPRSSGSDDAIDAASSPLLARIRRGVAPFLRAPSQHER